MCENQIPEPDIKSDDFVGRNDLIKLIRNAIRERNTLRVINIQGAGGIGKTSVLREVKKRYPDDKYPTVFITKIIDFFDISARSRRGFMLELLDDLERYDKQLFESVRKAWDKFTRLEIAGVPRDELEDERKNLIEAFNTAYKQMALKRRIVILIDTFELVQHMFLGNWLAEFLKSLENTVAIIAGRKNAEWQDMLVKNVGDSAVTYYELKEFEEQDTEKLFELSKAGRGLEKDERQKLQILSNGRPILLTLALDWQERKDVNQDSLTKVSAKYSLEDLNSKSKDELKAIHKEFEAELVSPFMELKPHHTAINLMAIIYKYFTPEMLAFFMDISAEEAHKILSEISKWTFIKFNKKLNSYQLHDLVRDIIVEHVWTKIDQSGAYRTKMYKKALEYYDKLISDIKKKEEEQRKIKKQGENQERDAINHLSRLKKQRLLFQIQRSYYDLMSDYKNAVIRYLYLFVDLTWAREKEFYDLLREERKNACKMLGKPFPEAQIHMEEARIKIVAEGKFDEGLTILNSKPLSEVTEKKHLILYALILLYKGVAHNYKGDSKKSEEYLQQSISILTKLEKKLSSPLDSENIKTLQVAMSLGRAYTNLGYLYYSSYRFTKAITAFKEAMKHAKISKQDALTAAVKNDLAFMYARLENRELARILCKEGLKIREELLIEYYIGLSYSMRGRIEYFDKKYERGENYCQKALAIFQGIGDKRGLALANRALGANLTGIGHELEDADKFKQAEECLIDAEKIFREKPEPIYLIEIYEYLGLLYEDWGALLKENGSAMSYFDKAEEYFERAIQQAKEKGYKWYELHLIERLFGLYFKEIEDMGKAAETLKDMENKLSGNIPENFDFPAVKRGVPIDDIEIEEPEFIYLLGRLLRGKGRLAFTDYLEKKEPGLLYKSAGYYTRACAYIEKFSRNSFGMDVTLKEVVYNFEKLSMEEISQFRNQVIKIIEEYGLGKYQTLKQWIEDSTGLI